MGVHVPATAKLFLPGPGELVAGKYRIERSLGAGGMAHVFAAHHELLDKPIALKVLSRVAQPTDDPERELYVKTFFDRFVAEARAAARIDSPHVTRVMEIGTLDNGLPFMVMERLVGCDLDAVVERRQQQPIDVVVDWVMQALDGVAHAHAFGIVHRDLKPANLFLCNQLDGSTIVKVMDFGIAKFTEPDAHQGKLTGDGGAIGSPMYMAPEQIRNASAVDERADIWALGVVLYELLTGVTPFEQPTVSQIFAAVLEKPIARASTLRSDIPPRLDDAIMLCLERDVGRRCPDVVELAARLEPFASARCAPLVANIERTLARGRVRFGVHAVGGRTSGSTETTATLDQAEPKSPRKIWASVGAAALLIGAVSAVAVHGRTTKPVEMMPTHAVPAASTALAVDPLPVATPVSFELPADEPKTAPNVRAKPVASATPKPTARPSASVGPAGLFEQRF